MNFYALLSVLQEDHITPVLESFETYQVMK